MNQIDHHHKNASGQYKSFLVNSWKLFQLLLPTPDKCLSSSPIKRGIFRITGSGIEILAPPKTNYILLNFWSPHNEIKKIKILPIDNFSTWVILPRKLKNSLVKYYLANSWWQLASKLSRFHRQDRFQYRGESRL